MKSALMRYATPTITGLFLVSLVSGVALFFHFGSSWFHGMHEWLSMVLIVPFGLHIWKNWRAFLTYFRRSPMVLSLAASVLAGVAFVVLPGEGSGRAGGPPQFALADTVISASPSAVAPVLGMSSDDLVSKLKDAGFSAADAGMSLKDIASASGKKTTDLYGVMMDSGD